MWPCARHSSSKCGDFAGMRMYSTSVGTMAWSQNSAMREAAAAAVIAGIPRCCHKRQNGVRARFSRLGSDPDFSRLGSDPDFYYPCLSSLRSRRSLRRSRLSARTSLRSRRRSFSSRRRSALSRLISLRSAAAPALSPSFTSRRSSRWSWRSPALSWRMSRRSSRTSLRSRRRSFLSSRMSRLSLRRSRSLSAVPCANALPIAISAEAAARQTILFIMVVLLPNGRRRRTPAGCPDNARAGEKGDRPQLPRQRVRPQLDLHRLVAHLLAALVVEQRAGARGGPQGAAFPAGLRVVDAAVDVLREQARGIGQPEREELAVGERVDRVAQVAHRDRHVPAEAQDAEPVHPDVVARLGAAGRAHVAQLRPGERVERPALGAMLSCRLRPVQHPALAAVERAEMAARARHPVHAVGGAVAAARPERDRPPRLVPRP